MGNTTPSLREKIQGEIAEAKTKQGTRWYLYFGNFSLSIVGCPSRGQLPEMLDRYLGESSSCSDLRRNKTFRQFYADIDDAFRRAKQFERMIEKSKLLSDAHNSRDARQISEAEGALAETFIESYILLREMGYSADDL